MGEENGKELIYDGGWGFSWGSWGLGIKEGLLSWCFLWLGLGLLADGWIM